MIAGALAVVFALLAGGGAGAGPGGGAGAGGGAGPGGGDVVVTEQVSRRVVVYDGARRVWGPPAERWGFSPLGDPRYADLVPERSWVHPDEAKVRRWRGRTYLLTTASYGFAAVVAYPSGDRYWAAALAPGTLRVNPHSAELLSDGSVVVAGSTGDLVRRYEPPPGRRYADFRLDDAHGLQWDERLRVLWALGRDRLVALRPYGNALRQVDEVPLPSRGGHDLGQVARDPDRLWVTTNTAVYQYVKSRRAFVRDARVSRPLVKAVGDDPLTGRVLSTAPEPGLGEPWWTTTADVHPTGAHRLPGGGIYKARWWPRLPYR